MKTVHNSHMVAHLWAHQTQSEARNPTGNFYFHADTIWSYGTHFPVARHVACAGKRAVLFTNRRYSNTTSGHKANVLHALPRDTVIFRVTDPTAKPSEVMNDYAERINQAAQSFQRRRNKGAALDILRGLIDEADLCAAFFGRRRRFGAPKGLDLAHAETLVKKYRAQQALAEATRERKRKAAETVARADAAEKLERWLRGDDVRVPCRWYPGAEQGCAYLRLRPSDPQTVETSMGAEFPRAHCPRLLIAVRSGVPYQHNGHTLHAGVFRVDAIDAEGNVRAGCHHVTRAECERFAAVLGL